MRALVLDGNGVRVERSHPEPVAGPGDVRIRVLRAGVCETDLQLVRGYMGFQGILGHEFVGVAESGPFAGHRVVGEINCACGACATCESGLRTHCPHRSVLGILNHDGVFADTAVLPQANLHPVPGSVATDEAVFAEPLAAAFQIPAQMTIDPRDNVVVLGDGRLGNLYAQVLGTLTGHVLVVGKHPEKLEVLRAMGIATCLLADAPVDRSADVVVDCTGSDSGLPLALRIVRPRGTIVMKTTVAGEHAMALAGIVIDELTLVGSRCGPFDRALTALSDRTVQVRPLISARFPLDRGLDALEAARGGALKVLIDVGDQGPLPE
ncbi:MAG: zinc-binding dehydrogenase [Acidimicrobiia bacterium]|nr:zinc-binding dehydrogenase [Acidimicrobiia bacterium]